jgi:hypothetical protein
VSEHRDPLDNSNSYVGNGYGMGHQQVPWGVQAPAAGENRPAEQRAMRDLELATTSADDRGIGPLGAGETALAFTALSVLTLWLVGRLPGFGLAVVTGVLATIYGLRSRRSAHYRHGRAWWLGTAALVLTVASFVGCLALNVLVPDKSRGGASCVVTGDCPTTGR